VGLYTSVEKAQSYLEAIDVKAGVYRGFDSEGYPLELSVRRRADARWYSFGTHEEVSIRVDETKPKQEAELREILVTLLAYLRVLPENVSETSLAELVELALAHGDVDS